jgi:hypothetical protein
MQEVDAFPAPQRCGCGGTIRWAVGDPGGPRSKSWNIVGSSTADAVYIGPRLQMGAIKLSLHRSGHWRMAWTEEYADLVGMLEGEDRVPRPVRAARRDQARLTACPHRLGDARQPGSAASREAAEQGGVLSAVQPG